MTIILYRRAVLAYAVPGWGSLIKLETSPRGSGHAFPVLTAVAGDFLRPMGNSFSSVRDTLTHILGAEWIWLERWQGPSPKALLDAVTFPTAQSLESRWATVERDQMQFIDALTPQRLGEELPYINQKGQRYSYPLWQQLVHVVNHSSYHRGQVTTLLRQLGAEAVSTDFLVYFDEKPKSRR